MGEEEITKDETELEGDSSIQHVHVRTYSSEKGRGMVVSNTYAYEHTRLLP